MEFSDFDPEHETLGAVLFHQMLREVMQTLIVLHKVTQGHVRIHSLNQVDPHDTHDDQRREMKIPKQSMNQ